MGLAVAQLESESRVGLLQPNVDERTRKQAREACNDGFDGRKGTSNDHAVGREWYRALRSCFLQRMAGSDRQTGESRDPCYEPRRAATVIISFQAGQTGAGLVMRPSLAERMNHHQALINRAL
jgi:hypothetical protein